MLGDLEIFFYHLLVLDKSSKCTTSVSLSDLSGWSPEESRCHTQGPTGGMLSTEHRAELNKDVLHMNHTECTYE